MPDFHTPDECASDIVQMVPTVPGAWVSRTEHGDRVVTVVPEFPSLTIAEAKALRAALGVLIATVEDDTDEDHR